MSGGYRGIVIALLGVIALISLGVGAYGSLLYQGFGGSHPVYVDPSDNDASTIAVSGSARSASNRAPCKFPIPQDESELCAQWKAADAASEAADYALWTLLISAVGTGLLVWTLRETRLTSRRELRAYVKFVVAEQSLVLAIGEKIKIRLHTINYGHTPAINGSFQHSCGIREREWVWNEDILARRPTKIAMVLHKDSPNLCQIESENELTKQDFDGIQAGKIAVFARGIYFYDDVFGQEHMTQVALEVRDTELRMSTIRLSPAGNWAT